MTSASLARPQPRPVATFRKSVLVVALGVFLALGGVGIAVHTWLRFPRPSAMEETGTPPPLIVPDVISKAALGVPGTVLTSAPIVATQTAPADGGLLAQVPVLSGIFAPDPPTAPAATSPTPPTGASTVPPARAQGKPSAAREEGTPPTPAAAAVPRKRWDMLAQPQEQPAPVAQAAAPFAMDADGRVVLPQIASAPQPRDQGRGQGLIQQARWEIPAQPLKTIYRSQTLSGQLLHAVHSDLPGQLKIRLTMPVLDKFGQDTVILPVDTLVIATQEGTPVYGNTRLKVKLEQLELPTGEVVQLKASIGDEDGANGLPGKVHNHYGKVLLAAGISALVNIGVKSAGGTPGPNQFFPNPIQGAAEDIGASVQQETEKIVSRELRVPPTITRKALTFCTIQLQENIQFNRPPLVVK